MQKRKHSLVRLKRVLGHLIYIYILISSSGCTKLLEVISKYVTIRVILYIRGIWVFFNCFKQGVYVRNIQTCTLGGDSEYYCPTGERI